MEAAAAADQAAGCRANGNAGAAVAHQHDDAQPAVLANGMGKARVGVGVGDAEAMAVATENIAQAVKALGLATSDGNEEDDRAKQRAYWAEHSATVSVEAMMLDSQALLLDRAERPEVLGMLPDFSGRGVIELGAGMGRFTGDLAKHAKLVVAVDFMENFIQKNKQEHGHLGNIDFRCADVTSAEFVQSMTPHKNSAALVFTNWLMMYLADSEVQELAGNMLSWLEEGGCLFFRESCFHQSGDAKRKNNPTHYRDPDFYTQIFDSVRLVEEDGRTYGLELVTCRCLSAYVLLKKNQNQVCWVWKKVREFDSFQRFLDGVQYTNKNIRRYERIYGRGFVSAGGPETTTEFSSLLNLQKDEYVLDVGCGVGGGAVYMAETYGVHVYAIDLSLNMIAVALEHAVGRHCSVEFEVADCTRKQFAENTFDVIFSRDTILHIQDKPALFRNLFKWLKPGGRFLATDYCKAPDACSADFTAYIRQRGYDLHDIDSYGKFLEDAGFVDVKAEDRTEQFQLLLETELARVKAGRSAFVQDFSETDYNEVVDSWEAKLDRCKRGEQRWGLFMASKPA
eukprot:jgi/Chlat1/9179/Chrsp97S08451